MVPNMSIDADQVASALASVWVYLIDAVPNGWSRRHNGVVAGATGVPLPTLNGVWPEAADPDVHTVSDLLDELASTGIPHCLQLRPGASEQLSSLAADRGMAEQPPIPLMALEQSDRLGTAQDVEQLRIRQLAPDEARLHARTAARGFEAPEDPFLQLMTPAVLARPGTRCYVGEIDGEQVTTGLGVTLGQAVGIFNIATPPEHRGRGFGTAVTARAVADGLAVGARWSYLQSTEAGYPVYRRMGFVTVEQWDCWVAAS